MKTAAAYARFSSDMQREESIEAQLYDIRRYAEKNNLIITKIYTDDGVSGRTDIREGFMQMMSDAQNKEFDYIIVHKVDRFARNKYTSAIHKHRLMTKGIKVLYAAQSISDSPEGRLMEGMLENFAQYYSENLAEEVLKGLYVNARKAKFNGGTPPLGYDIDENKEYIINESEALIVKKIFELYINGSGYTAICRELNLYGFKNKQGKPFVFNSIKPILTNVKYIGIYEYNKTSRKYSNKGTRNLKVINDEEKIIRVEDALPSIIEKEVFYQVADIIKSRQNVVQKGQRRKYLLKGLVECGSCGNIMPGQAQTNSVGSRYYYYRCKKCKNSVNAEELELFVVEVLKVHFANNIDRLKQKVIDELADTQLTRNSEKDLLEKRMAENYKEQDELIDIAAKGLANDKLVIRLKELDIEYLAMKEKHSKLTPTADITESDVIAWLDELKENLETYDKIDRVIQALVDKIIVNGDDLNVHLKLTKECISTKGVGLVAPFINS